MAATAKQTMSGLARALAQQGRLTETEADTLTREGEKSGAGFAAQLVASGKMGARDVAVFASDTFGYPLLDLSQFDPDQFAVDAIDKKLMRTHRVLALKKRGSRLSVAIADPSNLRAIDEIRFQTGLAVDPVVVETDKLSALVDKLSESVEKTLESLGAVDFDFEPYEKFYRIRYRTDGVLREITQPPLVLREKIASRIKVISRLDISEKRVPQDGRMKFVLSKTRAIDFRVSTLPTLHGEKIVMRILDPNSAMLGIDALGYEPEQRAALMHAVERPYGMVLVTGPTGSGKTVSLYTCLNILNKAGVNISTAEDPAEINLPGVNQVNVNDKAGLTFAAALKSFLRQDPDVIMVGEIRDLETAEISIKAAQTGHLVLSTLHTNDAPTTLDRMRNMGIAAFNIASSVILITAQRLARRLCSCKQPMDIPVEALLEAGFTEEELDGSWQPYGPVGCDRCKGSGYKGRVGIYQVMPISDEIAHIIMTNGNSIDIANQAKRDGVKDLRQSGLLKVRQGVTSLAEVLACTNE
jgi:type IV pilus assembly protein PilB